MSEKNEKVGIDMQHIVFGLYTVGALCFFFGTLLGWFQYMKQ